MIKALFVALALGAGVVTGAIAQQTVGAPLSAPGGRFVFGQIGSGRIDQYMLDTQTGQVWQVTCMDVKAPAPGEQCQTMALSPILYVAPAGTDTMLSVHPNGTVNGIPGTPNRPAAAHTAPKK